jgi:hypothetical protein
MVTQPELSALINGIGPVLRDIVATLNARLDELHERANAQALVRKSAEDSVRQLEERVAALEAKLQIRRIA